MKESSQTILIIDDEAHDVEFIRRAFIRAGVMNPIQTATNGEEAIEYLSGAGQYADRVAFPFPRVIITDLKMPRMGGLELLKWIHANPRYRVVPTVVLTSSAAQTDVDAAFTHGAVGYMVKPLGFRDLEVMVKTIADYWRLSLVPGLAESARASAAGMPQPPHGDALTDR
jgi:CheY-like chemotaxis protein